MEEIQLFWFRRDLRLEDNVGLFHALQQEKNVQGVFVFDVEILSQLENKQDRRVQFIHDALTKVNQQLEQLGAKLWVFYGKPLEVFKKISAEFCVTSIYCNHDYEPYALQRDQEVRDFFSKKNADFYSFKDQCIFEKLEIAKDDGLPYTVFTPYKNKWLKTLRIEDIQDHNIKPFQQHFRRSNAKSEHGIVDLTLESMGFAKMPSFIQTPIYQGKLSGYQQDRDFPALDATTRLSVHLRFGTVSIRQLLKEAWNVSATWVSELIWRDFYFMILANFPHVVQKSFKPAYDQIVWRNNEQEFQAWCEGKTGYPMVDAGMRELNATGFMHNRVRMVVASFLTKHLLIDWRWGEAYFAKQLNDFELSSNNGGWQWASGSGCDAAPYFRIFNPHEQLKKFDPQLLYVRKWVSEYDTLHYPLPIVDHAFARDRCLKTYKVALQAG